MANYVYTRCTITGPTEHVEAFRTRMLVSRLNEDGEAYTSIDFNKVTNRIPEVGDYGQRLLISAGNATVIEPYQDFVPDRTDVEKLKWRVGLNGRFSWCVVVKEEPIEFLCATKWDFPEGIFKALSEEFLPLHFKCEAVEEGGEFAVTGYFNPPEDCEAWTYCDFSEELYERVWNEKYYGHLDEGAEMPENVTSSDEPR